MHEREVIWSWSDQRQPFRLHVDDLHSAPVDENDSAASWQRTEETISDLPRIELELAGDKEDAQQFTATVHRDDGWKITQPFEHTNGRWIPKGAPNLHHPNHSQPTARQRRELTIDPYIAPIGQLLQETLHHLDSHRDQHWRPLLTRQWNIKPPRSRRGRKPELDPALIEHHRNQGETLAAIGYRLHCDRQAIANARYRNKRRRLQ